MWLCFKKTLFRKQGEGRFQREIGLRQRKWNKLGVVTIWRSQRRQSWGTDAVSPPELAWKSSLGILNISCHSNQTSFLTNWKVFLHLLLFLIGCV